MVSAMVNVVYVHSSMSTSDSATFFVALAAIQLVAVIGRFGQEQIMTRERILKPSQSKARLRFGVLMSIAFALIGLAFLVGLTYVGWERHLPADLSSLQYLFLLLWILGSVIPQIVGSIFRGSGRSFYSEILSTVAVPLTTMLLILIIKPENFSDLLGCYGGAGAIAVTISWAAAHLHELNNTTDQEDKIFSGISHVRESSKAFFIALMSTVATQMPVFTIAYIGTDAEISDFGLIYRFTPLFLLPANAFALVMGGKIPSIFYATDLELKRFNTYASRILTRFFIAYLTVVLIIWYIRPITTVQMLIPSFNSDMFESLLVMVLASVMAFGFGSGSQTLVSFRLTNVVVRGTLALSACTLMLYALSIPLDRPIYLVYVWSFATLTQAAIWFATARSYTPVRIHVTVKV